MRVPRAAGVDRLDRKPRHQFDAIRRNRTGHNGTGRDETSVRSEADDYRTPGPTERCSGAPGIRSTAQQESLPQVATEPVGASGDEGKHVGRDVSPERTRINQHRMHRPDFCDPRSEQPSSRAFVLSSNP